MIKSKQGERYLQIYSDLKNDNGKREVTEFVDKIIAIYDLPLLLTDGIKWTWRKNRKYKAYYINMWGGPEKAARKELNKTKEIK